VVILHFQIIKVDRNETTLTLHLLVCTRIALEHYNNSDQQWNRHDYRWHFLSWPTCI